eukprot:c27055_g1_i2 orf=409-2247(+)
MEGMGDSYDLLQRLQSSFGASTISKSSGNSGPSFPPLTDTGAQSIQNQSRSFFGTHSHPASHPPSSHSPSSPQSQSVIHSFPAQSQLPGFLPLHSTMHASKHSRLQPSSSQMPLNGQPRSLLQPNSQRYHQTPPPSHSRSLSQPSFFSQNISEIPHFTTSAVSHSSSVAHNPLSPTAFDGLISSVPSLTVKKEAASPSISDPCGRSALSVDVHMNDQETSQSPPSMSGHSLPPLPPLSPPLNSMRGGFDLRQTSDDPPPKRGHRRARSEIPFRFSSGSDPLFDRPMGEGFTSNLDRETVIEVDMEKNRCGEVDKDTIWEKSKVVDCPIKKELDWGRNVGREVTMTSMGEKEGGDDLFSMYIDMEKINCFQNTETGDIVESTVKGRIGDIEQARSLCTPGYDTDRTLLGTANVTDTVLNFRERGDSGRENSNSTQIDKDEDRPGLSSSSKVDSLQEGTDSGGESEKDEIGSRINGPSSLAADNQEKNTTAICSDRKTKDEVGRKSEEENRILEAQPSRSLGGFHHSRSSSMDSLAPSFNGCEDVHQTSSSQGRKIRHFHSHSMDGSANLIVEFGNGEFDASELQKIMANEKLSEIALTDPKRAKRILANRQSA